LLQSQKMEAIGQLTGGIAHDFNNLLQVVNTSFAVILRQPEATTQVVLMAQTGKRATLRGAKLTQQLLTFSRQQELEMQALHLAPLLHNMVDMLKSSLGTSVTLTLDVSSAPDTHVFTDPTQLELMLINLAVNARDAMPGGGGLNIELKEEMQPAGQDIQPGRYARISVRDTGHGMTEEVARRVFEPFFTTKGPGKGTGLGLSMVYGVARQSGGKVEVRSAPGEGTTISVLLPCVQAEAASTVAAERPAVLPPHLLVLLVDDDEVVRDAIREMLRALALEVREAASAAEALAQIDAALPDVMLLDQHLPDTTGAALAQRLHESGRTIAVVLTSGDGSLHETALPETIVTLRKPFEQEALKSALARAVALRKAG
jgi:CheY-like chemotaxis protein/two-component sensor histidine kinase